MKFYSDVDKEALEEVIKQYLHDLHDYKVNADKAYAADSADSFHQEMGFMFGLAEDMLKNRLLAVAELDEESDEPVVASSL